MLDINFAEAIKRMAVAFVPLMLGIILHEVAHGWMAARRGDPTATQLGRITLNPLPHIDPMGLGLFVLTSLTGPFVFGWAKPVPINPRYFKNPVTDIMLVSFAGPAANFLLAVLFAIGLRVFLGSFPYVEWHTNTVWYYFFYMLQTGVAINLTLGWFNLMPIPPLDGSKILWGLLPASIAGPYMGLERYGFLIIMLLLMTGIFGLVLFPLVRWSIDLTLALVGI